MALIASKPKGKKASAIIGDATDRLLRSVKNKMLRDLEMAKKLRYPIDDEPSGLKMASL